LISTTFFSISNVLFSFPASVLSMGIATREENDAGALGAVG
jgi:hypothetical protein